MFTAIAYAIVFCGLPWIIFRDTGPLFWLSVWGSCYFAFAAGIARATSSSISKIIENSILPELSERATTAIDEDLANRIRELIASEDGYTEQKMFGGIGFMIDGHMALGVSGEGGLMIHCSKEETEALLAKPGARPFEMRGREMKGWLRVDAESVSTKRALEPWAMRSVAFARALPPKEKK